LVLIAERNYSFRKMKTISILLVIASASVVLSKPKKPCDEKPIECHDTPVDLALVVDTSSSINGDCQCDAFSDGKAFLASLMDHIDIGQDKSRVAVVQYGNGVADDKAIAFDALADSGAAKEAIMGLEYNLGPTFGSQTFTGEGIKFMANELAKLRRDGIPMLAIVITDGVSNYADTRESSIEKTLREAVAAREKDIKLISIGVGNNPDDVELVGISGNADRTLRVDDYKALETIKSLLINRVCSAAKGEE